MATQAVFFGGEAKVGMRQKMHNFFILSGKISTFVKNNKSTLSCPNCQKICEVVSS